MTASRYELRLRGPVSATLAAELGVTSQVEEPAQTVLCTELADQAAIYGLLARLSAVGLELIEIRRISSRISNGGYGPQK